MHGTVFEKGADGWGVHKSAYQELRPGAGTVLGLLGRNGSQAVEHRKGGGSTTILARV